MAYGAFNVFDLADGLSRKLDWAWRLLTSSQQRPLTPSMYLTSCNGLSHKLDWAWRLSASFQQRPMAPSIRLWHNHLKFWVSFGLRTDRLRRSSLGPPFSLPSVPTHLLICFDKISYYLQHCVCTFIFLPQSSLPLRSQRRGYGH